jgi:hypothetical protein
MRRKMAEGGEYKDNPILGDRDKFLNDLGVGEFGDDDTGCDDDITISRRTDALKGNQDSIKEVLRSAKWLDIPRDDLLDIDTTRYIPPYKARRTWTQVLKSERKLYTANKLSDLPAPDKDAKYKAHIADKVEVVPYDYFRPTFRLTKEENDTLINQICKRPGKELNREQERAFKLVAEHASSTQPTPLKMSLGGMGGSGKSAVFNAIIAFFVARKEE